MYGLFDISTSGLVAQRVRLETIASNIANQETLLDANGRFDPWRRRSIVLAAGDPAHDAELGTHVQAIRQADSFDLRFLPGHPYADDRGYVRYPDVDPVLEQVDALDAVRAYEANIAAVEATKSMFASALAILA